MDKEKIATTYKEYKSGAKQVESFGKLVCYQGLDYLEKLLENDKYYSEELEDSFIFIESYINTLEQQVKKQKEVIDKYNKIEKMFKNKSVDLDELRKIVLGGEK